MVPAISLKLLGLLVIQIWYNLLNIKSPKLLHDLGSSTIIEHTPT